MYSIACVKDGVCYACHNKLYYTVERANSGLKLLQKKDNNRYKDYKVYEVRLFDLKN